MKSTEFIRENDQSDSDLFGDNHLVSTLADKFEFPEEGALGYKIGGGGISYGGEHRTEGLVIVDRKNNQIAFIPDFTYFDDEPTQEDLDFLFYDEDGVEKLPLSMQNIKKFLSLKEDDSDDDLFADRKSTQLATFFAEMAREWYGIADDQRADDQDSEYADGTESDANSFEEVSNAFKLGMEAGLDAFRGLDTMLRENAAEQIEEVLDIDLYALAYGEDLGESDNDELFGNPAHRRIAQWLMNFANTMRNNPAEISGLSPEDGQEYENDLEEIREEAKAVRFVANVFEKQGMVPGLRAWHEYMPDWWENFEDNLEADTGISISALLDQHQDVTESDNNDESDDELFGGTQTPPKTAQALYQWSRMDPNRYNFRAIAGFALSHKLTLKQALQVTSRFDEYDDRMQAEYGVDDDEMGDLFGAYEEVCDAWNTDPSGDTSTNDSWEKLQEVDAELEEPPERPRKTTTKTKPDLKFDIPFQQAQDQPLAHTDPLDDLKKKAGVDDTKVNLRKASQKDTLSKTSGLSTPDMSDMLGRMRNIELDKDLEAYPDEPPENLPSVDVNTQNLPAVAGQALQAAGVQNPEFHQVANLPGNMADQIRQLGKSLFGSLTMTPTKRIHVVANLGGQGPNSTQEVNAVAGFLKKHGDDRGPGDIDFEQVMPGYKAQTHMYTAAGIRWMLVKDFAGQYIYCWPEEDSHDASPGLEHDQPEMKQLR